MMSYPMAWIIDIPSLAALTALGYLLARLILPRDTWPECLALSFPVGAGTFSWIIFLGSLTGLRISTWSVIATWLVASLAVWLWLQRRGVPLRGHADHQPSSMEGPWRGLGSAALTATGALIGLSLILSVGRAQSGWDAMAIWSAKGYGIALEGTIQAGRHWGELGLSYPLNIPLLISFFSLFDGDVLPGSKLIFPLFYAALVGACYLFWRRRTLPVSISSLGLLTLASVPVVYDHATLGYANLPEACYLVLGLLYLLRGALEESPCLLFMSSLLLGLGIWTRPEGALLALAGAVAMIVIVGRFRVGRIRAGIWLLPVALIGGSWLAFVSQYVGSSHFGGSFSHAWASWIRGDFNLAAFRQIAAFSARQIVDPSVWGVAAPLLLLLIWLGRRRLSPKADPVALPVLVTGLVMGTAVLAYYYLASFSGPPLDWWLSTGLNRTVIPAVCLLIVGAFLAAGGALPEAER